MTISGECFCGAVTYEITGGLGRARSCHCSRCRKAFSAQASAYAVLAEASTLRWIAGEDLLTTYTGRDGFGLRFCSICGSTICGTFEGEPHGVTLGCVNGDPGVEISEHIFVGSKAAWEVIPGGVRTFEEGPEEAP